MTLPPSVPTARSCASRPPRGATSPRPYGPADPATRSARHGPLARTSIVPGGGSPHGRRDITRLDPSWGWAAGQLVSSPRDLNSFFSALLGGEVLRPAEQKEMKTTVRTDSSLPDSSYGLGLFKTPLSCGGELWGHGGDINDYETRGGVTEDGRAVSVAVTALPGAVATDEAGMTEAHQHVLDLVDTAVCK
ncbi:serine hydrolase [Streptomyces sp. NPDC088116]|uniref:serine hydrolase n=1 Tax=Streptomyces sp. NPDC088116 TaxID=3365825 RepID=UPI0037F82C02